MMAKANATLRDEVHKLAEAAFHRNLISGYGDGEYAEEFQLVIEGKPRHFSLESARSILDDLLAQSSTVQEHSF